VTDRLIRRYRLTRTYNESINISKVYLNGCSPATLLDGVPPPTGRGRGPDAETTHRLDTAFYPSSPVTTRSNWRHRVSVDEVADVGDAVDAAAAAAGVVAVAVDVDDRRGACCTDGTAHLQPQPMRTSLRDVDHQDHATARKKSASVSQLTPVGKLGDWRRHLPTDSDHQPVSVSFLALTSHRRREDYSLLPLTTTLVGRIVHCSTMPR